MRRHRPKNGSQQEPAPANPAKKKAGITPVGQLLRFHRSRGGLSLRQLAQATGLSHSYLASLETGIATPSDEALERLSLTFKLDPGEQYQLEQAAEAKDNYLIAPNFMVSIQEAIKEEKAAEPQEVWVIARKPVELEGGGSKFSGSRTTESAKKENDARKTSDTNDRMLEVVKGNIERGCLYYYFVQNRPIAQQVWKCLNDRIGNPSVEGAMESFVKFIQVPAVLHPILFNPGFVLCLRNQRPPIIGWWLFRSSLIIDRACQMDQADVHELHLFLSQIVEHAREGQNYDLARQVPVGPTPLNDPRERPLVFYVFRPLDGAIPQDSG